MVVLPIHFLGFLTRRSRRESARFVKTLQLEATEESFEVKNAQYPVPSLHDDPVGTSGQISAESSGKNDNEEIPASENACLGVVNVVDATKKRFQTHRFTYEIVYFQNPFHKNGDLTNPLLGF